MKVNKTLEFKPGSPNLKARKKPIQHIVCHWTGSENRANAVFNTLKTRANKAGKPLGLSIDYIVDGDGAVWECNPDIDKYYTQHAGVINSTSIGIEIVNYAIAKTPPKKGADRIIDTQVIHGRKQKVARFRPVQVRAVYALCRGLCASFGLPFEVLGGTTTAAVADFRGIIGHFHVARTKNDPGPLLLSQLKDMHHVESQLVTAAPKFVEDSYTVKEEPVISALPTESLWQRMVDVVTGWCR